MNALELHFHLIRNRQYHVVVIQLSYATQNTRSSDDLIAFRQIGHQLLMFFLALTLRANRNEVKQHKQTNEEEDLKQLSTGGRTASGLCVGLCNKKAHFGSLIECKCNCIGYSVCRAFIDDRTAELWHGANCRQALIILLF